MKKRHSFVTNSSSTSFMIIGKSFSSSEEAKEFLEKFKIGEYKYTDNEGYVVGIDIDPGLDGFSTNAIKFQEELNTAINKFKEIGIEDPMIYGECKYEG